MSTNIHPNTPVNQLPEVARETANQAADSAINTYQMLSSKVEEGIERTKDYVEQAVDDTKDAANHATNTAKDMCHSAALKAEDTMAISKDYVRRNPVPVVLGAIVFGAAVGYLIMCSRRKPTFSERYAEEPLATVRGAILTALAPVTQRVHEGYDSARDSAGKAMDRMHRFDAGRTAHSLSDQIGRISSNLKFW